MKTNRLTIKLNQKEVDALIKLSQENLRHPREQVRLIIRRELERNGLLTIQDSYTHQASQKT